MSEGAIGVANWLIGVDTGGTFTDLIAFDQMSGALQRAKVPSVPGDPSLAVIDALEKLFAEGAMPADVAMIVHGTTVATNALLEGKGVRTGLLITKGFRAVYEARGWSQPRGADLLDTFYQKPPLLVPQYLTEEVEERLDYEGHVITPLNEEALRASARNLTRKGVEAIAVCFLFSFVNPTHEKRAAKIVAQEAPNCRISISSEVLPVIREYPRLSTTVVDRTRRCSRAPQPASSPAPTSHGKRSVAMSSPSIWGARRRTSASSSTAQFSKCPRARSQGRTSARRCCACVR
jgi:N-methylhydantoinase A